MKISQSIGRVINHETIENTRSHHRTTGAHPAVIGAPLQGLLPSTSSFGAVHGDVDPATWIHSYRHTRTQETGR